MRTLLALALLIPLVVLPLPGQSSDTSAFTTPHDPPDSEADEEFREERRRWMKAMHRAEPGVNVDVLNDEIRRAKRRVWLEKGAGLLGADEGVPILPGLLGYWNERGSNNQAGRTLAADIDYQNGAIYVASHGGQIWRGAIEGNDWRSLNDPERFPDIEMLRVYNSDSLHRIIVLYSPYVQYSDDEGKRWKTAEGLETFREGGELVSGILTDGPEHILYVLGSEWKPGDLYSYAVIYRSDNQGKSFSRVQRFQEAIGMTDISAPPGEDNLLILHGDSLSRLRPDGTMEVVTPSLSLTGGVTDISRLNLRAGSAGFVYLHARRWITNEVHASSDGGRTWRPAGPATDLFTRHSFAVSPNNSRFIVAAGVDAFYSYDGGANWEKVNPWQNYYGDPEHLLHADVPFVGFFTSPDGEEDLLISTDGGLYHSADGLQSVRNLSLHGLGVSQYYSVYTSRIDTNFIFAGSQDQGFQRSDRDEGGILDFIQWTSGDYGQITSGDRGKSVWTNYPGFSMYYPDALRSPLDGGRKIDFPTQASLWIPPMFADPLSPNVAWLAGGGVNGGAHLFQMKYDAASGQRTATEHSFDFSEGSPVVNIQALAVSPVDPDRRYVGTGNGYFWRSDDRGETWQKKSTRPLYFYNVTITPSKSDPDLVYAVGSGYSNPGVWVSRDGGETFDSLNRGLPPTLVYDLDASADDRFLFAATAVGPYMYIADSGSWFDISGGVAPDQTWWAVDYIDEMSVARFGTFGRGIWDFRLVVDTTNSVRDLPSAGVTGLAVEARLPSSGEGYELRLHMPQAGEVEVEVFDLTGRRVARLRAGEVGSGIHRLYWSGRGDGGSLLPSGEYFCVVSAFGTVAYAKVPLLR